MDRGLLRELTENEKLAVIKFCNKIQDLLFPDEVTTMAGYIYLIEDAIKFNSLSNDNLINEIKALRNEVLKFEFELNYNPGAAFDEIKLKCLTLKDLVS